MMNNRINIIFLIFLMMFGCDYIEIIESNYKDYNEVLENNAIHEGKWIPNYLPTTSTNINEAHNLDTNETWISFNFNPSEYAVITDNCLQISENKIFFPRKSKRSWWPIELTDAFVNKKNVLTKYTFLHCKKGEYIAVKKEKNKAFFWRIL